MKKNLKIITIFGTRPEAIKLAPLIKELAGHPDEFRSVICITAQHRQMLDQVLSLFELKPDYDLDVMEAHQSLFDITTRLLNRLKTVLEKEQPDIVLVQGDTSSSFIASLSAFYLRISVGHIEAGLRTNNKYHPFPEEINRRLISHIADYHFAPTESARQNLLSEGVSGGKIFVTGNTGIDALKIIIGQHSSLESKKRMEDYFLKHFGISFDSCRLILLTGHRRENFGSGIENISLAMKEIAQNNSDIQIVYPVHLNPNVLEPVNRILSGVKNIHLIKPLEYAPFVYLMSKAYLILSDSGGIQEEAPYLGKPVLVMRDTTERPEAVQAGTAELVGTDKAKIVRQTQLLLGNEREYEKRAKIKSLYGDGNAAEQIIEIIRRIFGKKEI